MIPCWSLAVSNLGPLTVAVHWSRSDAVRRVGARRLLDASRTAAEKRRASPQRARKDCRAVGPRSQEKKKKLDMLIMLSCTFFLLFLLGHFWTLLFQCSDLNAAVRRSLSISHHSRNCHSWLRVSSHFDLLVGSLCSVITPLT